MPGWWGVFLLADNTEQKGYQPRYKEFSHEEHE